MKYMGSKNRIAKHILPIMLEKRQEGQCWVEPFVGGGNMIDKVDGWRIGADSSWPLICALVSIRDNIDCMPKNNLEFTENDYKNRALSFPEFSGFASFAYSFSGKFWGGWCRDGAKMRDYVSESYNNAVKQSPRLQGVKFIHSSYQDLAIPLNSIIYCDPPYAGTTRYKDDFNHNTFWQWCRDKCKEGHTVFVSEYSAPEDFVCVWEKEIQSGLNVNTTKKGVERLFVHESQSM